MTDQQHANEIRPSAPKKLPWRLDQYLLLETFGRGGMGQVYLAKHGGLAGIEKYCIVKTLRKTYTQDEEYVNRFVDEARVVVQLNHRNICHVFDVGKYADGADSQYYLAMEFIPGQTLLAVLKRAWEKGTQLSPGIAIHFVNETLEALDYAHRHTNPLTGENLQIVHRDVSPQNVMVNYEGETKLIDFGLAASTLKMQKTQPNVVMGKLAYMAPEQLRGLQLDGRADLFACAVMLYELLVGERFYDGLSRTEIWETAGKGGYLPRRFGDLDPELQAILQLALHPDREQRLATCEDFREELEEYRLQKKIRAGSRQIRELLADLFAPEQTELRSLLARTRQTPSDEGNVVQFPTNSPKTQTIARRDIDAAISQIDKSVSEAEQAEQKSRAVPAEMSVEAAPVARPAEGEDFLPTEPGAAPPSDATEATAVKTNFTNVLTLEDTGMRRMRRQSNMLPWLVAASLMTFIIVAGVWALLAQGEQSGQSTQPVDVKPVDVKPVDVKPVDVKPVDVKPVDAKPVDVKPVDVKPVTPKARPRPRPRPKPVAVPTPKPEPVAKPVVEPTPKPKPKPKVVKKPRKKIKIPPIWKSAAFLQEHCPRLLCRNQILGGAHTPEKINSCMQECADLVNR